ncbi:venom serine carboxypeptidase-like [Bacillus rossius redtenbacheri]|uniref:venom serine carboxypeptidase-like n=1 Tax=Bacillus rossius redtenbacheri TaxID=93214 RepID=UPI002FDD2414
MFTRVLCLCALVSSPALALSYPGFFLRTPSREPHRSYREEEVGAKLILTSYIEAGRIEEARNLSRVTGGVFPADIPSYSGFLTVDRAYDSNLFFWFFPAELAQQSAPVLLWLQGGPGASSMYSLFEETGPFSVSADGAALDRNPYSWHKNHSVVYIDSPVGTGFSYTRNSSGYATNEVEVGRNLYNALLQFFTMFPELQKNDFFITGESYAGKYIPALGHTIHKNNPNASLKINLKGLAIGDGFVDPLNMMRYSDLVYQWGLVDNNTWAKMQGYEKWAATYIENEDYLLAAQMMDDDLAVFQYASDLSVYNVLENNSNTEYTFASFLQQARVRAAIHVGTQRYFVLSDLAYSHLHGDLMRSTRPWVEQLLDSGYRVVFFNGQLDVICGYPLTVKVVEALRFNSAEQYRRAHRVAWRVGGRVAGYARSAGNMTEVLVRGAGHMVAKDQPAAAFDLIYRITRNQLPRPRSSRARGPRNTSVPGDM